VSGLLVEEGKPRRENNGWSSSWKMTSTEGSVKVGILVSGSRKEGLSEKNTCQESVLQKRQRG